MRGWRPDESKENARFIIPINLKIYDKRLGRGGRGNVGRAQRERVLEKEE